METITNAKMYRHYGWIAACLTSVAFSLGFLLAHDWLRATLFAAIGLNFWSHHRALRNDGVERVVFGADAIEIVKSGYGFQTIATSAITECTENSDGFLIKYRRDDEIQIYRMFESDFDLTAWRLIRKEFGRLKALACA